MADIARPVIPWVGGKEKLAPYITQVFPPGIKQYLEPFGGSGAVLLSMPSCPGRLDIYNDLNTELSNLFLCVKERSNALLRELGFLPIHSREVFEFYRDFAAHKEVTLRNIREELRVLDEPACFSPEQAAELVRELKALGYGVYLLSNAKEDLPEYFPLIPGSECFDDGIISARWKLLKPQPEIYQTLLREYGLRAEECFFVDDLNINVEAAMLTGMSGTVFRGAGELRRSLREAGIPVSGGDSA